VFVAPLPFHQDIFQTAIIEWFGQSEGVHQEDEIINS